MRTLRLILFVLLTFPAFHTSAQAADIAFLPVESTTLAPADAQAIGELLAQSYASTSGQAVLAPSRVAVDGRSVAEVVASLSVPEYVRTDAVGLGQRIVVHAVRYRADGTVIYQVKMTVEKIDDMISVSDRIAKALFHRVDDELVRTRHNVTLNEAYPQTRRRSEKVIGFKTGLHMPFAKDAKLATSLSAAFNMRLELDRFFLEFGAGLIIPTTTYDGQDISCDDTGCSEIDNASDKDGRIGGLGAELGGSWYLTDGNIAPYVGVGVLPRLILSGSDDGLASMSPYAQIGLMLPRDSSTRFYFEGRFAQSVVAHGLDDGREVYPSEIILEAGIGW